MSETYATFGAAIDAVCKELGDDTGPFEIEQHPGIPWQAFYVCGDSWSAYIGLNYATRKWLVSDRPFTQNELGRTGIDWLDASISFLNRED